MLARWLYENRWLFLLVFAALLVRLHWNLVVHPPGEYYYSDMRGYMRRAEGMFTSLTGKREYDAFYPYGTHVLLYTLMKVFGPGFDPALRGDEAAEMAALNHEAIAKVYAVLGAAVVGFGYLLARRVSKLPFVAPAVGLVLVFYYPQISLGGYFLSEIPFSLCLVASTFFLVRLVDEGRYGDALWCGTFAALGFTIRPQILLSIALFGLLWIFWRRRMPALKFSRLLAAFVPLLLILAVSSWRMHYHTGRLGLISENGKFNQVFGRCHNNKIIAEPDGPGRRRTSFGPPPLIQLAKREQKMPHLWPGLDPAFDIEYTYRGYIGDSEILGEYIAKCVAKTGWKKQVEYSLVNALLLWRYNVMWPDSGKSKWRELAKTWGIIHANALAVPALIGLLAVFVAGRARGLAVIAVHLWAIVIIALAYIGGARFRSPYDPIIIVMAIEVYAIAAMALFGLVKRALGNATGPETSTDAAGS
ncbi:MAG: hypothetical protein AAF721_26170 [Myxococcota bacterium]